MAAPPNTTAETATVMTMPYEADLDVIEAPGALHAVWFAYQASLECAVGFWAAADPAGTYAPVTTVYTGTPGALTTHFIEHAVNRPIQLPVTSGETYYFEVHAQSSGVSTAALHISLIAAPDSAISAGSLAINDDRERGFPLVVFSGTTGAIEQLRGSFPAGETVALLATGVTLWGDRTGQLQLYSASLAWVMTPTWVTDPNTFPALTSDRDATFYVADGATSGPHQVTTLTATGLLGPVTWTLPAGPTITAIAVSLDRQVLYYYETGSSELKRWDLVAHAAMSPLAAAVTNYPAPRDCLLVLLDDTLLVGYRHVSTVTDSFVRHYGRDGTLLHTYALSGLVLNRLATALDDPLSFWAWSYLPTFAGSRFRHIQISDGAVLATADTTHFNGGVYGDLPTETPTARFGHANSCPFLVLRAPIDPCGSGPGPTPPGPVPPQVAPSYHLDARYIRRLRRAPHVANEHKRVYYARFELDLERGVGLATGQGSDPIVLLRLSRDGGHTWGEEVRMAAGALGAYQQRVIARRLGHARDVVFEVTVSDPVAWSLVQAWLDLEPGVH